MKSIAVERALEVLSKKLGAFHLITFSILGIPYVFQALFYLSYIFTAMRSDHRCLIPECEGNTSSTMDPPWLPYAIPRENMKPSSCQRFAPAAPAAPAEADESCSPESFSKTTQPCDHYVYPNKFLSIMTEWDITCYSGSEAQLALVGTLNSLGRLVGLPLAGYFSDRFGRRTALLAELGVSGCLGILRSMATGYMFFIAVEFVDPIFYDGIGGAAFILGMELMPTHLRGLWTAMSHVIFALGLTLLGGIAWAVPYWRWQLRISYSAALLSLPLIWMLPESIHWLVSKGRTVDAQNVIRKAASMNNIVSDELDFDTVQLATISQPSQPGNSSESTFAQEMREMLRCRTLVVRLLICCACWIVNLLVYDGLSVYSVTMAGDPYVNFIAVALIEFPAALITWALMTCVGRRLPMSGAFLSSALFCFSYHFLPADMVWPRVFAVTGAKFCVTIASTVMYVLSAEIFPTKVRHTMYAFCATLGRVGSMLAPQAPLLTAYLDSLPLIVFGCATLLTAGLALRLPETSRVRLPETVAEAAAI